MVDILNRQEGEKVKSRVSFLADQSTILMSFCYGSFNMVPGTLLTKEAASMERAAIRTSGSV